MKKGSINNKPLWEFSLNPVMIRLLMKESIFIHLITVLVLFISACSQSDIIRDYDHTHVFSNYKTYRWTNDSEIDSKDTLNKNIIVGSKIHSIADQILKEKNFILVNEGKVDFVISIHTNEIEKDKPSKFHLWWQPCGYTSVSTYEDNSLVIDIIDNGTELVWRGLAPGFLELNPDIEKDKQSELRNTISSILENFPPQ